MIENQPSDNLQQQVSQAKDVDVKPVMDIKDGVETDETHANSTPVNNAKSLRMRTRSMMRDSIRLAENGTAEKTPKNSDDRIEADSKLGSASQIRNPEDPEPMVLEDGDDPKDAQDVKSEVDKDEEKKDKQSLKTKSSDHIVDSISVGQISKEIASKARVSEHSSKKSSEKSLDKDPSKSSEKVDGSDEDGSEQKPLQSKKRTFQDMQKSSQEAGSKSVVDAVMAAASGEGDLEGSGMGSKKVILQAEDGQVSKKSVEVGGQDVDGSKHSVVNEGGEEKKVESGVEGVIKSLSKDVEDLEKEPKSCGSKESLKGEEADVSDVSAMAQPSEIQQVADKISEMNVSKSGNKDSSVSVEKGEVVIKTDEGVGVNHASKQSFKDQKEGKDSKKDEKDQKLGSSSEKSLKDSQPNELDVHGGMDEHKMGQDSTNESKEDKDGLQAADQPLEDKNQDAAKNE